MPQGTAFGMGAPIAGFRSAIGEREFAIASGGPPPPFPSSSGRTVVFGAPIRRMRNSRPVRLDFAQSRSAVPLDELLALNGGAIDASGDSSMLGVHGGGHHGANRSRLIPMKPVCDYLDYSGRDDVLAGGARMVPIQTPIGAFKVWTKRIGNNPGLRVLLLHGGPGATHEYLEACDSYLPAAGIEYYYYDQLGSAYSDQPDENSLWELDRFVDEVEQVRQALGLERDSFVLYGQSWGGILAIEYALAHPHTLKGLVISNMMSDVPAYNAYAQDVIKPTMDQDALREIEALEAAGDIENPRYMELLNEHHYVHHVLRMPLDDWPNPVQRAFAAINPAVYVSMQGPSELGISQDAKLAQWSRFDDLSSIEVPALVIGARYDTMDPAHMEKMAERLPLGRYLYCPEGSHLAMYDDQRRYFSGLLDFLRSL
jgi:proline iminopeptidase